MVWSDALDAALENAGFYEVRSQEERIWTLLAGEMESARTLFEELSRLFSITGGVSKIELETVRALMPSPPDFPMRWVHIPL